MRRIGVLAVQGGFERHAVVVRALGHEAVLVRRERDFVDPAALILPGGESTVQLHLLETLGLERALREHVARARPVLATCAGLVVSATEVLAPSQRSFGFVDVSVTCNGWGRQVESFEASSDEGIPLVFIRAPRITRVGAGVEVLSRFRGEPVLVRQGNVTCASFHPELTADVGVHERALSA